MTAAQATRIADRVARLHAPLTELEERRRPWLWLRVHVIYWRDNWPIITSRARINDEVAFAVRDTSRRVQDTLAGRPWHVITDREIT
jgi:P2-related tail formation protein